VNGWGELEENKAGNIKNVGQLSDPNPFGSRAHYARTQPAFNDPNPVEFLAAPKADSSSFHFLINYVPKVNEFLAPG